MPSSDELEQVARAVHEVARTYNEQLGDYSYMRWDSSPEWHREAVRAGVRNVLGQPGMGPADLHMRWIEFKEADGWRYGAKRNVEHREHPHMIPYGDLPPEQRAKSAIFLAVVKGLLRL